MTNLMRRVSKWGQPLKNIFVDYVEVSKDVAADLKRSPVKSMLWLLFGGIITGYYRKCPSLGSYKKEVIEYCNELGLCAEGARNHHAKLYIDRVSTMLNDGHVQYVNCGVFAIILQRSNSSKCHNYHETCSHLQPRIWTLHNRVLDIGVWDRWLILEKTMVNFDVSESEFSVSV